MDTLRTVKIIFSIAVLLFVAKPFLGFSVLESGQSITVNSILAKSFNQRKPEDFRDAEERAAVIHHQLANPPAFLFLTIAALLAFIFPVLFKPSDRLTFRSLNDIKNGLTQGYPVYLLIGKLSI
jgi:hypothetical protein